MSWSPAGTRIAAPRLARAAGGSPCAARSPVRRAAGWPFRAAGRARDTRSSRPGCASRARARRCPAPSGRATARRATRRRDSRRAPRQARKRPAPSESTAAAEAQPHRRAVEVEGFRELRPEEAAIRRVEALRRVGEDGELRRLDPGLGHVEETRLASQSGAGRLFLPLDVGEEAI